MIVHKIQTEDHKFRAMSSTVRLFGIVGPRSGNIRDPRIGASIAIRHSRLTSSATTTPRPRPASWLASTGASNEPDTTEPTTQPTHVRSSGNALRPASLIDEPDSPSLSHKASQYTLKTVGDAPSEDEDTAAASLASTSTLSEAAPRHAQDASAATMRRPESPAQDSKGSAHDHTGLLAKPAGASYGTAAPPAASTSALADQPPPAPRPWYARPLVLAGARFARLVLLGVLAVALTLRLALPTLDPEDRKDLTFPRSFAQLKALDALMQKYRSIYPIRIFLCWASVFIFVQSFSLPGTVSLSILGGAIWGVLIAVPLVCVVISIGSSFAYGLSTAFGPVLMGMPKWRARIDKFGDRIQAHRQDLLSYLIILRVTPIPHFIINLICPHVRIGYLVFVTTTFFGSFPLAIIHTTIGAGLESMSSSDEFNLISVKNFLIFFFVVVAALIPVILRRRMHVGLAEVEEEGPKPDETV